MAVTTARQRRGREHGALRIAIVAIGYFAAHHAAFLFPDSAKVLMAVSAPRRPRGAGRAPAQPAPDLARTAHDDFPDRTPVQSSCRTSVRAQSRLHDGERHRVPPLRDGAPPLLRTHGPLRRGTRILGLLVAALFINGLTACLGGAVAALGTHGAFKGSGGPGGSPMGWGSFFLRRSSLPGAKPSRKLT